jgi:hypothetical protein
VLVTSPKLEVDDIDMKEDNINMEEVLTYRKRPYRCLKRPEITDTENSCDSSESIQSLASAVTFEFVYSSQQPGYPFIDV